jgi:multidrug resistance efflux pump
MHDLLGKQAIAAAEADDADAQLKVGIAQRDAAQQTLDELQTGTRPEEKNQAAARASEAEATADLVKAGARAEDLAAAQAAVDAAQGKLDQVQSMIDELTIRAPAAALVESLDLRPGDILAPNAVAATLLEDGELYVRIYVPETHLGQIHEGQAVPILVDSFPNEEFHGVVEHINEIGEYSPRNLQTADERADQVFATRIGIVDGQDVLRAGMAAFIRVPK